MLTPRIIADLRSGDECADPDHSGLRVCGATMFSCSVQSLLPGPEFKQAQPIAGNVTFVQVM